MSEVRIEDQVKVEAPVERVWAAIEDRATHAGSSACGSAGAHLAALALIALRDRGEAGAVAAANLAYGVCDVSMTLSARCWGDRRLVLNTPDLAFFAAHYARASAIETPRVAAVRRPDRTATCPV
jgi:acetyl esterase/lipase